MTKREFPMAVRLDTEDGGVFTFPPETPLDVVEQVGKIMRHGSGFADNDAMRKGLREPFPPEQVRQVDKGFGPIDYVPHSAVTDRLNEVAPGWTHEITRFVEVEGKDGMVHLLAVFGWMEVGGVRRWETGDVEHPSRYGDELKKALSDFISRAAMRFGVGLDLWNKDLAGSTTARGTSHADRPSRTGTSEPGPAESSPGETTRRPVSEAGPRAPRGDATSQPGEHRSGEGRAHPPTGVSPTSSAGDGGRFPSSEHRSREGASEGEAGAPSPEPPVIVEDRFVTENEMTELVKLMRSPARLVAMSRRMFPDAKIQTPADLKLSHYHSIRQAVQRGAIP